MCGYGCTNKSTPGSVSRLEAKATVWWHWIACRGCSGPRVACGGDLPPEWTAGCSDSGELRGKGSE